MLHRSSKSMIDACGSNPTCTPHLGSSNGTASNIPGSANQCRGVEWGTNNRLLAPPPTALSSDGQVMGEWLDLGLIRERRGERSSGIVWRAVRERRRAWK